MKIIKSYKLEKISGGFEAPKCGTVGLIWIPANYLGGVFASYWNALAETCWAN